ncbi:MAG: hypothetical protein MJA83_07310, partial [Gammaproteobacteria bacterium]|nr:hypothetical protein [Gammaproteobacteria bacterium]
RRVEVDVINTDFRSQVYLFRDDGVLDRFDDLTNNTGGTDTNRARFEITLNAGDYFAAISGYFLSDTEVVNDSNFEENNDGGDYRLRIDTIDGIWRATDEEFGWGIDGLLVDLGDGNGPYRIISNTDSSLIVETPNNLAGIAGNQLVGVHIFDTIRIENGARVDFGSDRVIVLDTANSVIDASSTFTAAPDSVLP